MKVGAMGSAVFRRGGRQRGAQRCAQHLAPPAPVRARSEGTSSPEAVLASPWVLVAAGGTVFRLEKQATGTVAEPCGAVGHLRVHEWIRAHTALSHSAQPPSWLQGGAGPRAPGPRPRGTLLDGVLTPESRPRSSSKFNAFFEFLL